MSRLPFGNDDWKPDPDVQGWLVEILFALGLCVFIVLLFYLGMK